MDDSESWVSVRKSTFESMVGYLIEYREMLRDLAEERDDIGEVLELTSNVRYVTTVLHEAGLKE